MKSESVWQIKRKKYPRLEKDIERDVVVIGGGIAGYLAAFRLTEAGRQVTLIEADRLFSGTTGRTTAKISAHQGNVYADLAARYGRETAALYYQSQNEGIRLYKELVRKYAADCDFSERDSYIFSRVGRAEIESLGRVMREIGAECEIVDGLPFFPSARALKIAGQYLFHPLKFLTALPVGFEIYEETRAVEIDAERRRIRTDRGLIRAHKIVVATHYPIVNSHGGYFMKLRQSMSYTIAVDGAYTDAMYLELREDGLSVRPYAEGTLLGGGDHRTGRIKREGHFAALKEEAQKLFGAEKATHQWCAEDVMTFDGMPMAGRYAKSLDDVYVVTGFNKWGMTNAMVCASVLADAVAGRENAYAGLFSPQRRIKKSFGSFISNAAVNAKGIFLGYCRVTTKTAEDVPPGKGMIVFHNGKRRAVYKAADGTLHVIGRMCPHMHCELKWNGDTNTWDCPCHGSRFDIDGNLIAEPAVKGCRRETERE